MWCSSQWGCGSLQSWPVNNHLENMNIRAKSDCIFQSGHKPGCGGPTRFPTSMLKAVFVKSMRTIARAGLLSVFAQAATSSLWLWNKQSCRVQTSLPAEGKDFFLENTLGHTEICSNILLQRHTHTHTRTHTHTYSLHTAEDNKLTGLFGCWKNKRYSTHKHQA